MFQLFWGGGTSLLSFSYRNNGPRCPAEDVSQQQCDRTIWTSQCCKYRNVLKISHRLLHSLNFFRIFKLIYYLFTEKYKLSHRNVERDRTRDYKCTLMQMLTLFQIYRRTQWTIYWNRVHHRINWYSALTLQEGHLLWRIEICTKSVLHRMELDCKDRTLRQMAISDTMRCVGLYLTTQFKYWR
jgi:hypothetical protein